MATLDLRRFDDIGSFEEAVLPFLMEDEACHNLLLGICSTIKGPDNPYERFDLWCVEKSGRVVAAAMRTPPHQVVLSRVDDPGALALLAEDVDDEAAGVLGDHHSARIFADLWSERTRKPVKIGMRQRIYKAESATRARHPSGHLRDANERDIDFVVDWFQAFAQETFGEKPVIEEAEASVRRRLDSRVGGLTLWCDPDPVSLAGYGGPTPNGMRVGPVYTPPELRGRGYASACVAETTARLLQQGRRFCFLFTDLANPTSNSIYQRIGYRPVCDVDQWRFGNPTA